MFERILYTTLVDLSLPYGPGVNERTFAADMLARYRDRFRAVIPRPAGDLPAELEGLNSTPLPNWGSVRNVGGWIQANVLGASVLRREIRSFQPDLIVMRTSALVLPHYWISRTATIPYVLKSVGDVTFGAFYERSRLRRSLKPLNDNMFNQLLYNAVCVDLENSALRDLAIRVHPGLESRIHVIDNGVDLGLFDPVRKVASRRKLGLSDQDFVVGYVGSRPMRRGGREVIDVVAGLGSRGHTRGLIVGDSGEAAACRQYASSRGVSDSVIVYGEANYGQVPDLMASIDVGLSILWGRERMHSEQKVRQYLATGLCVVGTAGSNDFLRGHDFARIVEARDSEEIVNAAAWFIDQGREGFAALGRKARGFAESNLSFAEKNSERIELWNTLGEKSRREGDDISAESSVRKHLV